jgi:hypothetical protein
MFKKNVIECVYRRLLKIMDGFGISSNSRRYDLAGVCIECCLGLVLVLGLGLHVGSGPGLVKVGFRVRVSHRCTCSYNRCSHHNPRCSDRRCRKYCDVSAKGMLK